MGLLEPELPEPETLDSAAVAEVGKNLTGYCEAAEAVSRNVNHLSGGPDGLERESGGDYCKLYGDRQDEPLKLSLIHI